MSTPLVYQPLSQDSIRLFRLNDQSSSSTISGSLVSVKLDNAPLYHALSYCWGEEEHSVPLQIDGCVFHVNPNLAAAIQCLQDLSNSGEGPLHEMNVKWLWIDKICVNQDNGSERCRQVELMGSIFSKASRTLIWLGMDFGESSKAWALVDCIFEVFKRETPNAKFIADLPFRIYSDATHAAFGLPPLEHDLWKQLNSLLHQPWFTRVWVIQEVVLSPQDPLIIHGHYTYPWYRLGWVASWLRRSGYLRLVQVPNQLLNVDMMSNIRRSGSRWNLDTLLFSTSVKTHATDQRDKVYGLLGLAAECQNPNAVPPELRVDYNSTVPEVYKRVALFLLRKYGSLAIFTRARGFEGDIDWNQRTYKLDELPSWIPDWSDFQVPERKVVKSLSWLSHSNTSKPDTLGFPKHCEAAGTSATKLSLGKKLSLGEPLHLSGLRIDVVSCVTSFDTDKSSDTHQELAGERQSPITSLLKLATSVTMRDAQEWITCFIESTTANCGQICGRTPEQLIKDGSAYLLNLLTSDECQGAQSVIQRNKIISKLEALSVGGDSLSYITLARNFCYHRTFFVTSNQRMGIGPYGTQRGDCVAVVFGGGVPFILRERSSGYHFVGESFVHGLAKGEAIEAWRRGNVKEETIELW